MSDEKKPRRYDHCDGTCTVDCGHCKGNGPPVVTAVPLDGDRLDALERLAEKAEGVTDGVWRLGRGADCLEFGESGYHTSWTHQIDEFIAATDPPTVLALVAALRASWAEVERLNGQLGDCIGCRYDEGPDEYCPQHGRTYTDVLDVTERMIRGTIAERDEARAALAATRQFVDNPGNWSALDGRRAHILSLLDGSAASRTGAVDKVTCEHGRTGWHEVLLNDREAIGCPGPGAADKENDR